MKILFWTTDKSDEKFNRICQELANLGHRLVDFNLEAWPEIGAGIPALLLNDGPRTAEVMESLKKGLRPEEPPPRVLFCGPAQKAPAGIFRRIESPNRITLGADVNAARMLWKLEARLGSLESDQAAQKQIQRDFQEIGASLTAERYLDRLLDLILKTCRQITGADSGSLYLVTHPEPELDEAKGAHAAPRLKLKFSQNESQSLKPSRKSMAINRKSLVGSVAMDGKSLLIDDAYNLDPKSSLKFDKRKDSDPNHRTKSLIVTPLFNHKKEIIGVLTLANRKRHSNQKLESLEDIEEKVISFQPNQIALVEALTSQAAVSIENSELYENIEALILGVVEAFARTAETRNPLTRGRAWKVMDLSLALANAANMSSKGPLEDISFTIEELKELQYAALLYDIGKIGVREELLTRSVKISPAGMEAIKWRFERIKAQRRAAYASGREKDEGGKALEKELREIGLALEFLRRLNLQATADDSDIERARQIAGQFSLEDGEPCLAQTELDRLCAREGTLTDAELEEIRGSILLAREMLNRIPWLDEMKNVPVFVGSSQERYDGSGFPIGLAGEDIPLGSRILAVVDCWMELTFLDRERKRTLREIAACKRMIEFAESGRIDPHLTDLFVKGKLYKAVEMNETLRGRLG